MFKKYDEDGSGCIAYDEMRELVRETGAEVEGQDMAAVLLDKYSQGTGEIPYMKVTKRMPICCRHMNDFLGCAMCSL